MEPERFMQAVIFVLIGILIATIWTCNVKGITLDPGECWQFGNDTVCAANCTKLNNETCQDFIDDAVSDLESECKSFANITTQISSGFGNVTELMNDTFANIKGDFFDKCREWESQSKACTDNYDSCKEKLSELNADDLDVCQDNLKICDSNRRMLSTNVTKTNETLEQARANVFTGAAIAFFAGLGVMWFLKVRKKESEVEGEHEGYTPSELR